MQSLALSYDKSIYSWLWQEVVLSSLDYLNPFGQLQNQSVQIGTKFG